MTNDQKAPHRRTNLRAGQEGGRVEGGEEPGLGTENPIPRGGVVGSRGPTGLEKGSNCGVVRAPAQIRWEKGRFPGNMWGGDVEKKQDATGKRRVSGYLPEEPQKNPMAAIVPLSFFSSLSFPLWSFLRPNSLLPDIGQE